MEMNILESRDKSALPNAPEWAKREKAEKRPLHLVVRSLAVFARIIAVGGRGKQSKVAKTAFEHNSFKKFDS